MVFRKAGAVSSGGTPDGFFSTFFMRMLWKSRVCDVWGEMNIESFLLSGALHAQGRLVLFYFCFLCESVDNDNFGISWTLSEIDL